MAFSKLNRRRKLKLGIRKKIYGTEERPRLTVFRSNKEIYAQVVNDDSHITMASANSLKSDQKGNKIDQAKSVGKLIAEASTSKGIKKVVFDRNGYLFHGRVKALADAARENGLEF